MTIIRHIVGNLASISGEVNLSTINGYRHALDQSKINGVVNPANRHLDIGGGVTGALVSAVGGHHNWYSMVENGKYINGKRFRHSQGDQLNIGDAVYTVSQRYVPHMKYIIHTLGPVCGQSLMDQVIPCIVNSLELCRHLGINNLYLPAISGGIFAQGDANWPHRIRQLIYQTVNQYLQDNPIDSLDNIYIVSYDTSDYQLWMEN